MVLRGARAEATLAAGAAPVSSLVEGFALLSRDQQDEAMRLMQGVMVDGHAKQYS